MALSLVEGERPDASGRRRGERSGECSLLLPLLSPRKGAGGSVKDGGRSLLVPPSTMPLALRCKSKKKDRADSTKRRVATCSRREGGETRPIPTRQDTAVFSRRLQSLLKEGGCWGFSLAWPCQEEVRMLLCQRRGKERPAFPPRVHRGERCTLSARRRDDNPGV